MSSGGNASSGGNRKRQAAASASATAESAGGSSVNCQPCCATSCCRGIYKCIRKIVLAVLLCLLILMLLPPSLFEPWIENNYVFDPAVMQQIAQKAIQKAQGGDKNSTVDRIVDHTINLLKERYPDHIHRHDDWILNNAGGAMGSMLILHSSLTEYVIIFGTAVGTEGHTGRFLADDFFTILHGEQWAFPPGSLHREVYAPGEQHILRRGHAKQYRMPDSCWALEYARGNIVSMLPFGFLDTFASTLDFVTLYRTVVLSVKFIGRELLIGKI